METINNKYKVWHDNIITKAKNRTLTCYTEKHHIIPKCLGGSNNEDNLVRLTAKEHFIVHMLLCKFTEGKVKHKMLFAFNAMSSMKYNIRIYKLNSRTASVLREQFYKSLIGRKDSEETKKKKSLAFMGKNNPNYGKKFSEEHRKKLSISKIGEKHNLFGKKHKPETIQKMINKKLGKKHTEEARLKMSKSHKGISTSKGYVCLNKDGKTRKVKKENINDLLNQGYNIGMDKSYITDEYRNKISAKLKGRKFSLEHIEKLRKSHTGKKFSDATKKKMSLLHKGNKYNLGRKSSEMTKAKLRMIQGNMIWVIKDNIETKINKDLLQQYLDKGYKEGRNTSFMNQEYKNKMSKIVTRIWQERRLANAI